MRDDMLLDDIANLKEDTETDKTFNKIVYDGKYSDWDYYPHQLIQYSTSGGTGNDAEAALYVEGTTLYGHVHSMLHMNEKEFQPFALRLNENDETTMGLRLVTVDKNGNIVGEPIVGAITGKKQAETLQKLIDQAIANSKG